MTATTYEENRASRRVMEKRGMIPVRNFRLSPADLAASPPFTGGMAERFEGEDV